MDFTGLLGLEFLGGDEPLQAAMAFSVEELICASGMLNLSSKVNSRLRSRDLVRSSRLLLWRQYRRRHHLLNRFYLLKYNILRGRRPRLVLNLHWRGVLALIELVEVFDVSDSLVFIELKEVLLVYLLDGLLLVSDMREAELFGGCR